MFEDYMDFVNIGDVLSDAGYNLDGWTDPWVDPGWGGNYGSGSSDGSFRLLMGPGDNCGIDYENATLDFDVGTDYANEITFEHLDGSVDDSFDVFIGSLFIGHYTGGQNSSETWVETTFDFPPTTGAFTVSFVATDPNVPWCDTQGWGQVAFSWIGIEGYTCEAPCPVCGPDSSNYNLTLDIVDIGDSISEFSHPITGWSDANIPGNYGGSGNGTVRNYRQIIENPCTVNERNADTVLHAGTNIVEGITISHLDSISLEDSFEVYINNISVGTWNDTTPIVSEIWVDSFFDILSHGFSGDLTVRLEAFDPIWGSCNTYGQVAIDWISIQGCGETWEPEPFCGDGNFDQGTSEQCDFGTFNGQTGSACDSNCQWVEPSGQCVPPSTQVDADPLDSVDIGDTDDEDGHDLIGWSTENLAGGYGGCQQGVVCSYRQIIEETGCDENSREATLTLEAGTSYANKLTLRHLDGMSNLDSFDIYVNDVFLAHYEDEGISSEDWYIDSYPLNNLTGTLTIKLVATDTIWGSCSAYGQLAIDWIEISGYECEDPEPSLDFGDAPDSYKTLLTSNGARHLLFPGMYMGLLIDAELDGQPSTPADGDDILNLDDEDGVTFLSPLIPGLIANINVIASVPGYLQAWIDFNYNGIFDHPAERIIADYPVTMGSNPISFPVQLGAVIGQTYARFRLSSTPGLSPIGSAPDGEVEDYIVEIEPSNSEPEPFCGDGTLDEGEECDDGGTVNGDGCDSYCIIESQPQPTCGDGNLDSGEQCDDGNQTNSDGCSSSCTTEGGGGGWIPTCNPISVNNGTVAPNCFITCDIGYVLDNKECIKGPAVLGEKVTYIEGTWIKTQDISTVYFLDEDNIRHAYPHYHVWESYFGKNYSSVEILSQFDMDKYTVGKNILFKVGSLIKKLTTPKVYQVDENGILHWIKTEDAATRLFGNDWYKLIFDLPSEFWGDYTMGDDIE